MKSATRTGVRFLRYAIISILASSAAVLIVGDSFHDSVELLAMQRPLPSLVVGTFAAGCAYLWNATIWNARQKRFFISAVLLWISLDLTGFILAMIFG